MEVKISSSSVTATDAYKHQENAPAKLIDAENDLQALKAWLDMRAKRSNATYINYLKEGRRLILWCASRGKRLCDLRHSDISEYEDFLKDPQPREVWCGTRKAATPQSVDAFLAVLTGKTPNSSTEVSWRPFVAPLKINSVEMAFNAISSFFMYLHSTGYLPLNPLYAYTTSVPKQTKGAIEKYFGDQAWQAIMGYISSMPRSSDVEIAIHRQVRWIFYLAYYAGARRAEMAAAKMGDIYRTQRSDWEWAIVGKRQKLRIVPLSEEIMQELASVRLAEGMSPHPTKEEDSPLIPRIRGEGQLTGDAIYKIVKNVCKAAADRVREDDPELADLISRGSTHWLRHTCATHRAESGENMRYLQELLGHEDPATTALYSHVEKQRFRDSTTAFRIKPEAG